ncbi:MAG: V-type ATPase subunit [Clostridia bacterium]|nr:V-type ATPase subunit [Clostridia bacterium]
MKDELKYAYAVARTKAVENKLLDRSVIDRLIAAETTQKACRILRDSGWEIPEKADALEYASARMEQIWRFLYESAPDKSALSILTVENDFHNIKAAVKSVFTDTQPDRLYIRPTVLNTDELTEMSKKHDFSLLGEYAASAAQKAYEIGVETGNGQKTDIILDIAALNRLSVLSQQSSWQLLKQICDIKLAAANIKTAVRTAQANKEYDFIRKALCNCGGLDSEKLARSACDGIDAVYGYLYTTVFSDAADALKKSTTAFEKWADDKITEAVKAVKWKTLGFEPLVAYYYANLAEVKNVRIILGAKISGADEQTVRQRVRELYV